MICMGDRDAIVEKLIALLQDDGLAGPDDDADNGAFGDGVFEIDDKPAKKKKKKPKDGPAKPAKPKRVTREEAERILRELQQRINRANRERGRPCCDNMLVPTISGIAVTRKLKNGTFETPANGLFDVNDTITVSCAIVACPPLDIRMHLVDLSDQSSERILRLNGENRGASLIADPAHPNDPGSHRLSREIDLSQENVSVSASPASFALSVSVRDTCRRTATGVLAMTFVDFT